MLNRFIKYFIPGLVISCSALDKQSRVIRRENKVENSMAVEYIASSDPTREHFLFLGNNRFELILADPVKKGKTKFYTGIFSEKPDTIFLEFYKQIKPENREVFLLKDKDAIHLRYPYLGAMTFTLLTIKRKDS